MVDGEEEGSVPTPEGELIRMAVDLAPAGMLVVDHRGTIVLANREVERLFGYRRDELLGQSIDVLVPDRFRAHHPSMRASFFERPEARPMGVGRDLYGVRKDGSEFPVEIGLNPIRTERGVTVLCSVVDITTRRRTEEQLRQSQKMEAIGTLAGGIAHDFNNILLGIVGHAELLEAGGGLGAQQVHDVRRILHAAERGRHLVQRILSFSRQEEVAREPLEIASAVREVLELLRASIPATIELREELSPETPRVSSDATQLHQVLMNLVTNAAHAMPSGGMIVVRAEPVHLDAAAVAERSAPLEPGLFARVSVRDTGKGMSEDVLSRVLEPFFTTKGAGRGSGLGLAVVHGIVRSHGGHLEITSAPGEGTEVEVLLPAHLRAEKEIDEAPEAIGRKHLLLVDDEPSLASMLARQLRHLGYRVTPHTSSTDALEAFQARPREFDALVTDNTMPKLTGIALARRLLEARPELPILLVSGLASVTPAEELHALGVTKVLPKPHTLAQLRDALAELFPEPGDSPPS